MNSDKNICCYPLDVSLWEEKNHEWKDKLFLMDEVRQVFHVPLNMTTVVKRMMAKIEAADAMPEVKEFLMLMYDPSPWKSEIYMTVIKDIPKGKMVRISGSFISKVYDGPYNHVPVWIEDMNKYLANKNLKALKYYFHFAYCPKCVKKYGHNHCIVFAQISG